MARKSLYRFLLPLFCVLILFLLAFFAFEKAIQPTLVAMSEAKVESMSIVAMNTAVNEILGSDVKYTDLTSIITDSNGKISTIQYNTILINELARKTSSLAQGKIASMGQQGIDIPMGSATRSKILAGKGPNINVKLIPIGSVAADFYEEFSQAGINQTRHKIYISLKTSVHIVVPLGSDTIKLSNKVPITETIITGEVPDTFIDVRNMDQALKLIPID